MKRTILAGLLLFVTLLLPKVWAKNTQNKVNFHPIHWGAPAKDSIRPGRYYEIKTVRVREDETWKNKVLPETAGDILYYAEVKFEGTDRTYGIIMDLSLEEKRLWVDADADGDYHEEKCYELFTLKVGALNGYFTPEPLVINRVFQFECGDVNQQILFDLTSFVISEDSHQSSCIYLRSRTWFTGSMKINNEEIRIALTDEDDNGLYMGQPRSKCKNQFKQ